MEKTVLATTSSYWAGGSSSRAEQASFWAEDPQSESQALLLLDETAGMMAEVFTSLCDEQIDLR